MIISLFTFGKNIRLGSICRNVISPQIHKRNDGTTKLQLLLSASRTFASMPEDIPINHIRNFSIIAHIDHGKSTLADRFLEITGAIARSSNNKQVLDRLPVERQRGITVKAVAASLYYTYNDIIYELNLIDTPGHVDFSHEVTRSLSACQGVILLVDANEGIQAQTVANFYLACNKKLVIIPVLNKIDLVRADPDGVQEELNTVFGIDPSTVRRISAKTGLGVEELLKEVIEKVPPPKVMRDTPFKSFIVDSWYDKHRGSILFIYITDGEVAVGDEITSHKTGKSYQIKTTSKLCPEEVPVKVLRAGEVGVISCSMKDLKEALVGDYLHAKGISVDDLIIPDPPKSMVYAGLFARNELERSNLCSAMDKLLLNDPSVSVKVESSPALGLGWRLGFLGYLHLDVFRQRLEQEFDKEVVLTAPSVSYKFKIRGIKNIKKYHGDEISITNPLHFPDRTIIIDMFEPIVISTIISPVEYYNLVTEECLARRGKLQESTILTNNRILLKFIMPLSEIILDFHDTLKKKTSGYASYDYEDAGYVSTSLEKLTVLLNGKEVDELTQIVHSSRASSVARKVVTKLKELVPRQQVAITIQAAIGSKILAREDIKAYRKDVLQKLHGGGDPTRRKKLLKAQAEGKKRMRQFYNIEIPRDTFVDVLREY